jgi:hypothetical protein
LACVAGFADKVSLRTFHHVLPEGGRLPWTFTPVRPMATVSSNGVRCLTADKEFLGADVRPDDGPEDALEDEFVYSTDCDDDEWEPPRRDPPRTPPQRAADEERQRRAAEEEAEAAAMESQAPCTRCGRPDHVASVCPEFGRHRGAQNSPLAAQQGVQRDIGDDGTRNGLWSNGAEVVHVSEAPDSFYAAVTLALRAVAPESARAPPVTRRALCGWIRKHGGHQVGGHPLRDWVAFESDKGWEQVSHYADWMARATSWAGPIDCAAFAACRSMSLHVWRRDPSTGGFQQHASFHPAAGPAPRAVNLLHVHGRHYDVLHLNRRRSPIACLRSRTHAPPRYLMHRCIDVSMYRRVDVSMY